MACRARKYAPTTCVFELPTFPNLTKHDLMSQNICERFADIVRAFPDRIALIHGQESLSYAELREAALVQAAYLTELGVGKHARVYIETPRGIGQLISLLAVLHAGAAYVPHRQDTDPSRVAEVFRTWGITHILTTDSGRHLSTQAIRIDAQLAHRVAMSGGALAFSPTHPPEAGSPACILSTSGSTGTPKGILLSHRSHVSLVVGSTYCDFSANTRMLYYSPLSFDAATVEIWGPLLNGGLVAVSDMDGFVPETFKRELREHQINTVWITSGIFSNLMRFDPMTFEGVGTVLTGGDVVNPPEAVAFTSRFPGAHLVNCWGPAENATFSTAHLISTGHDITRPLPIGRAVNRAVVEVLDSDGRTVPMGVVGEIHVGGPGLFLGYVGAQAPTEDRLIEAEDGRALFKTGDMGYTGADGLLHFSGRIDDMVKVAGKQVRLNDVNERVLSTGAAVFCQTVAVGDASDKRFDFFVVPAAADAQTETAGWDEYHDDHYSKGLQSGNASSEFAGWVDSSSGKPIEDGVMREWLADFAAKVAQCGGGEVLDLGCGSGCIIRHLAGLRKYTGVDRSRQAIDFLHATYPSSAVQSFTFECSDALSFLREQQGGSDLVLLNSVLQYLGDKTRVIELLSTLAERNRFKTLYIGDLTTTELRVAPSFGQASFGPAAGASLYELDFPREELLPILLDLFKGSKVVIAAKLCADLNREFARRYDAIVASVETNAALPIQVNGEDVLANPEWELCDGVALAFPSYARFTANCKALRMLERRASVNGLALLPYFPDLTGEQVHVVIGHRPLDWANTAVAVSGNEVLLYQDPLKSQRLRQTIAAVMGSSIPIGEVHLLYKAPTTARGKFDRQALQNIKRLAPSCRSPQSALATLLGIGELSFEKNLYEVGMTSMEAVRAALALRSRLQVNLAPADLFAFDTVGALWDDVRRRADSHALQALMAGGETC